jgi:HlyD family secretion protein
MLNNPFSRRVPDPAPEPVPLALLEFQSPTAAIIATKLPLMARSINWCVSALVLSMLTASGFMPVDMLVSAPGALVAASPDMIVQAFGTTGVTSIVRSIEVRPGELVRAGQLLARLDPTYARADLTALTAQAQSYAAQVAQLQAQEDGKPYLPDPANPASALQLQTYRQQMGQYSFTMQGYDAKISELRTQIDGFNAQAAYYEQRLGIASNIETMRHDLQNLQVGSKLDTLGAVDQRVNMQAELASAVSSAAADEREIASQQAQRDSFEQQWKAQISQQLVQALDSLAQAKQALAKAQLNEREVDLTASREAIVQSIAPISVGSVLQSGQTLMTLTPTDAKLNVAANVNGTESGFVRVGDEVTIKFSTLPFLRYGTAKGTVRSISPESFNPLDTQAPLASGTPLPGAPQALYYRVQISLDRMQLHAPPPGFRLVPGMPVEADMKVGTRTVLGYFLQRIMPVVSGSLHEPS